MSAITGFGKFLRRRGFLTGRKRGDARGPFRAGTWVNPPVEVCVERGERSGGVWVHRDGSSPEAVNSARPPSPFGDLAELMAEVRRDYESRELALVRMIEERQRAWEEVWGDVLRKVAAADREVENDREFERRRAEFEADA